MNEAPLAEFVPPSGGAYREKECFRTMKPDRSPAPVLARHATLPCAADVGLGVGLAKGKLNFLTSKAR